MCLNLVLQSFPGVLHHKNILSVHSPFLLLSGTSAAFRSNIECRFYSGEYATVFHPSTALCRCTMTSVFIIFLLGCARSFKKQSCTFQHSHLSQCEIRGRLHNLPLLLLRDKEKHFSFTSTMEMISIPLVPL